jgi:hypothetical protein
MTHRTGRRIATVLLAPSAALATWALIRLLGVDPVSTSRGTVGPGDVLAAALVGALAGWAAARILEHRARRPRAWWGFVAPTGLAVSMIGPSHLADGSSAAALIALHVVTAAAVIAGLTTTIRVRGRRRPEAAPAGEPAARPIP